MAEVEGYQLIVTRRPSRIMPVYIFIISSVFPGNLSSQALSGAVNPVCLFFAPGAGE